MSFQEIWNNLHGKFTSAQWVSIVPVALLLLTYWIVGLSHLFVDYFRYPTFLYKYKIQKHDRAVLNMNLLMSLFKNVIFSQLFIFIPMSLALGYFHSDERAIGFRVDKELPDWLEMVKHFGVFLVCEEVLFFYAHWMLHQPMFYVRIHKIHHQFTAPIALAAIYAHPLEVIIGNIIPMITGPLLCNTHVVTFILWSVIGITVTETHHSGYRFPWTLPFDHQPNFHDYHHEYFNRGNYGLLGVMDYLHGTDIPWRQSLTKAKQSDSDSSTKSQ